MLLITGMAKPAAGKNSLCDSYDVMNGQGAKQPSNHLIPVTVPHREKLTKGTCGTNGYPGMESETTATAARSCSLLDLADAACNELQAISHEPDIPILSRDHRIQLDGNVSTNPGSGSRSELLQLLSIPPPHQLSSPSSSPATFPLNSTNATLQEVTPTVVRSWNGRHSQRQVTLGVNEVAQSRKRHVQSRSREPVAKARKNADAVIANPGFPPNYTIHPNTYSAIEMACSKSRTMFRCKKCSVVYCTRADIVEHVNKKHWMDYPGRLLCKECLVLAKKPYQFKKHVLSVHPNSEPYHYIPGKILENLQNSLIVPPDEIAGETGSDPDQHVTLAHSLTTIGNVASVSSCSPSLLSRSNQISNAVATKDHINGSKHNLPNVATAISPTLNMTSQPFRTGEVAGLTFTSRPPTNIAESHSYQTVPLHQMSPNTTPNVSPESRHQDSIPVIQSLNVSEYEPSKRMNISAIPSIIHAIEPIKSTHQTAHQFPHIVLPEAQTVPKLASSPHMSGFPLAYSAPPHISLPKSKQTGSLSTAVVRPRQSSLPDTGTDILLSPPETMSRPRSVDDYAIRTKVPPTPIVIAPLLPHKSSSSTKEALRRHELSKQMSAAMVTVPASMRQPVQQPRVLVIEPDTSASVSDSQLMTTNSATMVSIPHQPVSCPSIPTAVKRNAHVPGAMPLSNITVMAQVSSPIQQRHELSPLGQYGQCLPYPRFVEPVSPNSSINPNLYKHPTFYHLPSPHLFPPPNMQMQIGPRPMHQHNSRGLLDFPPKTIAEGHESKTYNVPNSNSNVCLSISCSDKFPSTNQVRQLERNIFIPENVVAKAVSKTAMQSELAIASATLSFEAMDAHTGTSVTTRQDKPTRAPTDVSKDTQRHASNPDSVSEAPFVGTESVDLPAAKKKRRPPVSGVTKPSMILKKRCIQKDQSMNKSGQGKTRSSQCSTSAWMTRPSTVIKTIVSCFDGTLTSPTSVTHLVPHHVHGSEVIESPSTTTHNSRYTDGDSASTICKSMPTDCSDATVGPLFPHNTDPSMLAGHSTSYSTDSTSFTSLTAVSVDSQISKIHAQFPENQTSSSLRADVVEKTDIQSCSRDGAPDINDDAVSKDSWVDLERLHISDIDELSKQEEESKHLGIVDNKSDTQSKKNETDSSALLASSCSLPFVKSVSGHTSVIHSKRTSVSNGHNESHLFLSKTLNVQCEFAEAKQSELHSPTVKAHACESMVTSDEVQRPSSVTCFSNAKTNIEDDDSFSSTSLPDIESCDDDQITTTSPEDPHELFREIAKRALGTCQVDSQLDAHVIDKYKALSSDDEDGCLTHRESLPVKARVVKAKPKPRARLSVLKEKKQLDKQCASDANRQKSSEHSDYDAMPELACSKKKRRLLNHGDNEPDLTSSPKNSEIDSLRQVTLRILGTSDQMTSMASQLETLLGAPVPAEIPTDVDQLNMRQLPEVTPISNSRTFVKAWGCKEQTATTLQCYVCSFQCKTEKAMFGHCGRHISVNPFSCSVCFIQKRTADAVARHIRIDHRFCHVTVCTENNMLKLRDSLCNNLFGYFGERFERGKNESIHLLLASGFVSFIPHLRYTPSSDEDVSRAVDEAIRRLCPSPVNKEVYADHQQPLRISSWDVLNGMIEDHSPKPDQSPKVDPAHMSKFSQKLFDGILSASGIKNAESVSPEENKDVSNMGSCEPNNNGSTPDREIAEAFKVQSEQKEMTLNVSETAQAAGQHKPMSLCDDKLLMYPVIVLHRL